MDIPLQEPAPLPSFSLLQCLQFLHVAGLMKPFIQAGEEDITHPPNNLNDSTVQVLSHIMRHNFNTTRALWEQLKADIWKMHPCELQVTQEDKVLLNRHGAEFQTYPQCVNHRQSPNFKTLGAPSTYAATLFTLREGALPVFTTSWKCTACRKRYYSNYYIDPDTDSRVYYEGVPAYIQVSQHVYMDAPLLEFFATTNVFGWLSAMNCARIYNESLACLNSHILSNKLAYSNTFHLYEQVENPLSSNLIMDEEHVLNAFFLYGLLIDKAEKQTRLVLSHKEPSQREHLRPALAERNQEMEGTGQEAYRHACDLCFITYKDNNGREVKMQCAVCDGNSMGHPCCAVHNCQEPLPNNRHRYCAQHQDLNLQCAVTDCTLPNQLGFRTCGNKDHRALEQAYFQRGQAIFQLRARLDHAGIRAPTDGSNIDLDMGLDTEIMVECDSKSTLGNRKLHAFFGRRRTHNEQLLMRPCGVILSQAIFFGSEAISSVNEFLKASFPTPESTPEFLIFDNNCKLDAHQKNCQDFHFQKTVKPVDVFHFRSKHKLSDTHCQTYCNPAAFPELFKNGKWVFNTSICEQTNVWLGGYHPILRDMEVTRYNFFLDEMIKRRNRYVIKQLDKKGNWPWTIPFDSVFPSR
ncbi:hypothetical protein BJ912DRAFT_846451 [Pholiota molesta]|nr:hypothetical protein BJ912DRAFT_846451 [Pholiota molesta]